MTAQLFVGTTTGDRLAIVPVITAVVLLVVVEGKKQKKHAPQTCERTPNSQSGEWAK